MKPEEIAKLAIEKGMSSVVVLTGDAPTQQTLMLHHGS